MVQLDGRTEGHCQRAELGREESRMEEYMLEGTITALVTPFQKVASTEQPPLDLDALEELIHWQLECGVRGFVVGGTTGESATLEPTERIQLVKRVLEIVRRKVPVIVGTGTNCTRTSIELTKAAKELGADGALIVSPYYNKPTQEGLYQHFRAVAEQGGLPIVVYNIPGRTSVDISLDTFRRLAKLSQVVAVKEASGSADKLIDLAAHLGPRVALLAGEDSLTYFVMAARGRGVISAASNVIPKEMVAITDNWLRGDVQAALAAQCRALPVIRALFRETNPAPAKAALKILGRLPNDTLRLPLVAVQEDTRELLTKVLF